MGYPLELIAMLRDEVDPKQLPQIAVQQSRGVWYLVPHSFASQVVEIVDAVEIALAGGDNLCGSRLSPVHPL